MKGGGVFHEGFHLDVFGCVSLKLMGLALLAAPLAFFLSACEVSESTSANDTTGDDTTDDTSDDVQDDGTIGTPPTGAGAATSEYFEVTAVQNINYPAVISKDGDGSTLCRVTASGQDIMCVLDMNELDLWFRGYQLNYTAPTALCEYLEFQPYYYNIAPIGNVPDEVIYFADDEGNILAGDPGDIANEVSTAANVIDIQYGFDGVYFTHQELYGSAATKSSQVRCPWNYDTISFGGVNGPKCCRGTYTVYKSEAGESSVTPSQAWGGKEVNCYEGAGVRAALDDRHPADDDSGLPLPLLAAVDEGGYSNIFKVEDRYYSRLYNFMGANYYHRADHAPLVSGYPDTPSPTQLTNSANYRFDCLDANFEVVARIRVLAREWNTNDEFAKFLAGISATPNETGTENGPDQSSSDSTVSWSYPDGGHNDMNDWLDCFGTGGTCVTIPGYSTLSTLADFKLTGSKADTLIYLNTTNYIGFRKIVPVNGSN